MKSRDKVIMWEKKQPDEVFAKKLASFIFKYFFYLVILFHIILLKAKDVNNILNLAYFTETSQTKYFMLS